MATWEYVGKRSVQKNLIVRKTLSRSAGAYGDTYVYDVEAPEVNYTLETEVGMTDAEATALEALATAQDGATTVTDNAGDSYTGRIVAVSFERAKGSELWQATLTLRSQADEA